MVPVLLTETTIKFPNSNFISKNYAKEIFQEFICQQKLSDFFVFCHMILCSTPWNHHCLYSRLSYQESINIIVTNLLIQIIQNFIHKNDLNGQKTLISPFKYPKFLFKIHTSVSHNPPSFIFFFIFLIFIFKSKNRTVQYETRGRLSITDIQPVY